LFRQDGARAATLPAAVYGLLFAVSLAMSHWSTAKYGAAVIWTANGVLLAGVLNLNRRDAIRLLIACVAMNVVENVLRHDTPRMLVVNIGLNLGEVVMAGVITRRFCGAALDMRRPVRLLRFALMAVIPTTLLSSLIGNIALQAPPDRWWVNYETWFSVEALGLLAVTPPLLLWAQGGRFVGESGKPRSFEPAVLLSLLAVVTVAVFAQSAAPAPFLVFPPLLLIAFRLSPRWSAAGVLLVALIAAVFTLNGQGPMMLGSLAPRSWFRADIVPVLGALPLYNLFMASVLAVTLPASTVLTERRRLEARLRHRTEVAVAARRAAEEAVATKGRFLSMMSHELRTPLNGVSGFAELLAARKDLGDEARAYVDGVRMSGERLLLIMDEILDFARGDLTLVTAPLSINAVVREAIDAIRSQAAGKRLDVGLESTLDEAARHLADDRRLRQVLGHLLRNAVKFTSQGGVVVTLFETRRGVCIRVSDTGPGLPDAMLEKLYEPFSQADDTTTRGHEGAGMGLALSRRLVRLMGGEIKAHNRLEGGSTFTVDLVLPRLEDRAAEASDCDDADAPPRILVVDDHAMNRKVARLLLEALGCTVDLANDGEEAVAAASGGAFDLILMDVRMPKMDGLAATRAIRALPSAAASTPVVAMTADAMPEDVTRCLAAGMDAHMAKPISSAGLLAMLQRWLGESSAKAGAIDAAA
jgi:signal transduction histidine kinase/ActR/RegA family two-component response regulator